MNRADSESRRGWIHAAEILAVDAGAKVLCPNCGSDYLRVDDVPADDEDKTFSRYLCCSRCGAVEIIDRLRLK